MKALLGMVAKTSTTVLTAGIAVLLAVSLIGGAVHITTLEDPQDTAFLRVAHGATNNGPVDVWLDNESVFTNVSAGTVTEYLTVASGTYNLTITAANDSEAILYDDTIDIPPRAATTVPVSESGGVDALSVVELRDDGLASEEDESAVRFIHLEPDTPQVDVTRANGTDIIVENLSFQEASSYVTLPAGNHTLELRTTSGTGTGEVLTEVNVTLANGSVNSAMVVPASTDNATSAGAVTVIQFEDAMNTIELPSNETDA